jgi:hypothetical protein
MLSLFGADSRTFRANRRYPTVAPWTRRSDAQHQLAHASALERQSPSPARCMPVPCARVCELVLCVRSSSPWCDCRMEYIGKWPLSGICASSTLSFSSRGRYDNPRFSSRGLSYLPRLEKESVELAQIPESGHFPMYSNPVEINILGQGRLKNIPSKSPLSDSRTMDSKIGRTAPASSAVKFSTSHLMTQRLFWMLSLFALERQSPSPIRGRGTGGQVKGL